MNKESTEASNSSRISEEDALKQMALENEEICPSNSNISTVNPSNDSTISSSTLSFEKYSQKAVKVFQQITDMMGDFFNSLKPLNASFAQYADSYFKTARDIATRTEKKELTEQEYEDLCVNILAGVAVTGIGAVWSSIKTQDALEKIKSLLRSEADEKINTLSEIIANSENVYDCACDQYNLCVQRSPLDYEDLYEKFEAVRLALYTGQLAQFLDATYKAALNNSFQNDYSYPTLFDVNQQLFESLFNLHEKHSSVDAIIKYHRTAIDEAIIGITKSIKENTSPTPVEFLLAKDPGLMGIAIHNYNPQETIGYSDEGELVGVDEDYLDPDCLSYLRKFEDLYGVAMAYASSSKLAECLVKNNSLEECCLHIQQLCIVPLDYKKHMLIINLNILLGGVLAFLVPLSEGIKWYWSLLIGVIVSVVIAIVSPANSTTQKFMKKLLYVERAIRVSAMNNAGYTKVLDLYAVQTKNTKTWIWILIGVIIGFLGGPLGAIVGGLVGAGLSKFLSEKDHEDNEYDYNSVSTGKVWKGYIITGILTLGIIVTIIMWIIPSSGGKASSSGSMKEDAVQVEAVEEAQIVESDTIYATDITEESQLEKEVISDLYRLYYPDASYVNDKYDDGTPVFSTHLKDKFNELGIKSGYQDKYTKSFNAFFDKISEAEQEYQTLILDYDPFENGQETVNLDLVIKNVKIIDNNNAEVEAVLFNSGDFERKYIMKRENGYFKIDDFIEGNESFRNSVNKEISTLKDNPVEETSDL